MQEKNNIFNFESSNINSINQFYIEKIYQDFINNSNSVPSFWKKYFKKNNFTSDKENIPNNNHFQEFQIINLLRMYGYKYANLNPIDEIYEKNKINKFLLLNGINVKKNNKLWSTYKKYKKIYCNVIGIQYMHIDNIEEKNWLQKKIENKNEKEKIFELNQINLLKKIIKSEVLEKYLHTKFPGSKRFSLEGCEILIPILNEVVYFASKNSSSKVIIGMAHRGRINVLVNILKKNMYDICNEFSGSYRPKNGTGDVKYHFGMSCKKKIKNKIIEIDLKPNPSHLEIINPVIMGSTRFYIEKEKKINFNDSLCVHIHGDAAIIGQGVNQELLNMSKTRGFTIGGSIHIVINNQIGFTTSNKIDIRSSEYCTDIAKITQSPIFHVNCDHPESALFTLKLALDFKYKFKKDVFIDLVCYRRRGHNESDEPSVTQPLMYKKIKNHPTVCEIYSKFLENKNIIDKNYKSNLIKLYRKKIEIQSELKNDKEKKIYKQLNIKNIHTGTKKINIQNLAFEINNIPNSITMHNRIKKIYHERQKMANRLIYFDWGAAENLAYANLLYQGISCRLSGEDISRGTFFHRHAIIHDQKNGVNYIPLNNLKNSKGKFYIWDSVLSEESVLAFEYGYSIESYNTLNIWEAQFGDFVNGAQIVIDQFISSGEQKWGLQSNLTLFLPHGYEGQGPEHSSSRLERFLQLCAQNNMRICIPSNAAQIYHIIIDQGLNIKRRPLIVITPKSILRNSIACSPLSILEKGHFKTVINEIDTFKKKEIKRIILCSGKIYYELLSKRRKKEKINVILIRIEQLYPFPKKKLQKLLNLYYEIKDFIWCQEEPKNQGAWYYIKKYLKKVIPLNASLNYIGRSSSAAPAVGSLFMHNKQQKKIIHDALNIN